MYSILKKISLAIVLLGTGWFSAASTPAGAQWLNDMTHDSIREPLSVSMELATMPAVGDAVDVNATVTSVVDAPNTTVEVTLPNAVQLLEGSLTWQGNLSAGGSANFAFKVAFLEEGEFEIGASAASAIDADNAHIGEGGLAVNIGATAAASRPGLRSTQVSEETPQIVVIMDNSQLKVPADAEAEAAKVPEALETTDEANACTPVLARGWAYWKNSAGGGWQPARYLRVELWDDDTFSDDYLGSDIVDSNGFWQVGWVNNTDGLFGGCIDIYNKFVYDASWARVENGSGNRYVWSSGVKGGFGGGVANFGSGGIPYGLEEYRARQIYLTARRAWAAILTRAKVPAHKAKIQYRHSHTSNQTWPHFKRSTQKIYLPGVNQNWALSSKQKTILHELGHHYQWELYGNWLPTTYCPSPHYINGASHNNCAWTEGWATFVATFVDQSPNAYGYNYENLPKCSSFTCGSDVEGRVTASLYDMWDSNNEGPHDVYTAGYRWGKHKIWDTVDRAGRHKNFWEFWKKYRTRYPKYLSTKDPCRGVRAIRQNNGDGAKGGHIWFNEWVNMGNIPTQSGGNRVLVNQTKYIDLWVYANDYECRDSDLKYVIDYQSNTSVLQASVTASDFIKLEGKAPGWSLIRVWAGDHLMWDYDYFWVNVTTSAARSDDEAKPPLQVVEAVSISHADDGPPGVIPVDGPMSGPGAPPPELVTEAQAKLLLTPTPPLPSGTPPTPEVQPTGPSETQTPEPTETVAVFETPEPSATPGGAATATPTETPTATPPATETPEIDPTDIPTATPTETPTGVPTSFPPTPTPTPPVLNIDPGVIALKKNQSVELMAEDGTGPYTWFASGGSITPSGSGNPATYQAGDVSGNFVVTVKDSAGSEAVANITVGGLEIDTKPSGLSTHLSPNDTLEFQITDQSAAGGDPASPGNRGPFFWLLDLDPQGNGVPNNSVGSIQSQAGGDEGLFTAIGNGITLVSATSLDQAGGFISSNAMLVIVGNTFDIPETKGVPGKTLNVRLNLNNIVDRAITNIQMTIQYPNGLLDFVSAEPTFRTANFTVGANEPTDGEVTIILTSLTGEEIDPGRGPTVDLVFNVLPGATSGQQGPLSFKNNSVTMVDDQLQTVDVQPSNGTVDIVNEADLAHDGDVNQDGFVNVIDLALAVQIFLERYAPSTEEFAAADISPQPSGDDQVNVTDVLKIFNKALGKPISLLRRGEQAGPIDIEVPKQVSAKVGETLRVPIDVSHPNDDIGGLDVTVVYTPTSGTFTPTLAVAQRAQHMQTSLNVDTAGQAKVILYSPDTVQDIPGSTSETCLPLNPDALEELNCLLVLDFGVLTEDVIMDLGIKSSTVGDLSGDTLAHAATTITDTIASDNDANEGPGVFLPIIFK